MLKNHVARIMEEIGIVDNMPIFNGIDFIPTRVEVKYANAKNPKAKDIVTSLNQKYKLNKFRLFIVGKIKTIKTSVKDINPKLRVIPSKILL